MCEQQLLEFWEDLVDQWFTTKPNNPNRPKSKHQQAKNGKELIL